MCRWNNSRWCRLSFSMDTGLGSPRSSSGYGSSEEDHQACAGSRRRRRKSLAQYCAASAVAVGTGAVSAPRTPQSLSPSDTGSSLSSPNPFSIDFRSVFEDSMPDFSDLAAFSEPDDVGLPVDLMGTWTNEFDVSDVRPWAKPTPVDVSPPSAPKGGDKRLLRDDSHILVTLLKRPKAELDWITTGNQPAPDQFLNKSVCGDEMTGTSAMTLDVNAVASASPLQRLKALTHSDVVNHAEPPSTKSPTVVATGFPLPAAAVPVGLQVRPPIDGLFYDGQSLFVRRQTSPYALPPRSHISATSLSGSYGMSEIPLRQGSDHVPMSLPRTVCHGRRKPSPAVRASAKAAGVRRVCSELDDHRYSSPMPPAQRHWLPQSSLLPAAKPSRSRRSSANGRRPPRRPSTTSRPTSSSPSSSSSSSVLEMLLRTSKQLRPNDGSDASLATCRETPPVKRPSSRRRTEPTPGSKSRAKSAPSAGSFTFLFDTLLADRDEAVLSTPDGPAVTATSSTCVGELPSSGNDSFSLFSEHLLCDSQGVIDVGLLTGDQPAWTPSRLDDKVTHLIHYTPDLLSLVPCTCTRAVLNYRF